MEHPTTALDVGEDKRLALGLGWFGVGLGAVALAVPRMLARLIGVADRRGSRAAVMAVGARELATGIGIVRRPHQPAWLWSRVAGDVMDLSLLGLAARSRRRAGARLAAAIVAVLGVTGLDVVAARRRSRAAAGARRRIARTITINRRPDEVYAFARDPEHLPRVIRNLDEVRDLGDGHARWAVRGPHGEVEWDVRLIEDVPGRRLRWQSLGGATGEHAVILTFTPAPAGRGTEVRVEVEHVLSAGRTAPAVAALLGAAAGPQLAGDLRRLKQVLEAGEIVHSDASLYPGPHPARPPGRLSEKGMRP